MMMQLRADHTLIRVWHFPIHDASGYVGRQLWSSLVSAMLVFIPVFFLVSFLLWQPTQRFFVFFVFLPLGGLALIELGCWGLRAWVNSIAVSGIYIRSRRIYGVYDFIGLYLHFLTGPALAVLRVLFTYADFAINFCRLDIPVLEGSLANFDPGHAAFMAMLYLDFFYNAPVTSVMAYNLSNALYRRRELKQISEADQSTEGKAARERKKIAIVQRNRWQFLFTATNNPSLLSSRVLPPPPLYAWDREGGFQDD